MRCLLCLLSTILATTPVTLAQSPDARGVASVVVARGRTWDDEGSLGSGTSLGGRVEWRLFGRTSVEASLERLSHERAGGFFGAAGRSAIAGASLLHRFGPSAVRIRILEGVSVVHHTGTTRFSDLRFERRSVDVALHVGVGVAIRVRERLEVGPEGRFYAIRAEHGSDPARANWIGVRAGVRF